MILAIAFAGASGCMSVQDRHDALLVCMDASRGLMDEIGGDIQAASSLQDRLGKTKLGPRGGELRRVASDMVEQSHQLQVAAAAHAQAAAIAYLIPRPSVTVVRDTIRGHAELREEIEQLRALMQRLDEKLPGDE